MAGFDFWFVVFFFETDSAAVLVDFDFGTADFFFEVDSAVVLDEVADFLTVFFETRAASFLSTPVNNITMMNSTEN